MSALLINVCLFALIGFVVWWFWLSSPPMAAAEDKKIIPIRVKDGVYSPAYIKVRTHQPFILRFIREDAQECAAVVMFSDLDINHTLPVGTPTDIPLCLDRDGEYEFTCQMGMYRGRIIAG